MKFVFLNRGIDKTPTITNKLRNDNALLLKLSICFVVSVIQSI